MRLQEKHMGWGHWLYRKVISRPTPQSTLFYPTSTLQYHSDSLLNWVKTTHRISVVPESTLISHFESRSKSSRDLQVVLTDLQLRNLASLYEIQAGRHSIKAVKFAIFPGVKMNVNEHDLAFLTTQTALQDIAEYIKQIEEKREKCHKDVLKLLRIREKQKALEMLKQEKQLDKCVADLYLKRTKIDQVVLDLVETEANLSTFAALKAAVGGQKSQGISVDEVEKLAEEIEEQRYLAAEVSGVIAPRDLAEEAALEEELNQLSPVRAEDMTLPEIPSNPLPVSERREVLL